ncbi:MAG: NAD(P)-dependent alcohol dehydrogenase [Longimicrobiales bacterium]
MKAVTRRVYGSPDVMEMADVEKPVPVGGEVLIRIRAASVNASDWEILRGKPMYGRLWGFFKPRIRILGSDIAGIVEAVGPNVTRFRPGDAVYGDVFESWGGFAEWVCVPERMLRPKPGFMSFEEAAAIPQSAAIALQGLRDKGQVQPGQTVLINGAGGGAGTLAIQIAKGMGAEVTGVDKAEKLDLMRSLGADHVIDYAEEDFTRSTQRYDLILDLAGHHSLFDFKRALRPQGRYILVGGSMKLILGVLALGPLVSLFSRKRMGILAVKVNRDLDVMEGQLRSGAVVPVIDKRYPLSETPNALRHLGEGRARGKLVIVVWGSDGAASARSEEEKRRHGDRAGDLRTLSGRA